MAPTLRDHGVGGPEASLGYTSGHEGRALYQWAALPDGRVRLMKANPKYPSIEVDPARDILRLLRVVRVVRRAT